MDHLKKYKKQIVTYLCILFSLFIISLIIKVTAQSQSELNESLIDSVRIDEVLYNGIVLPDEWPPRGKSDPRVPPPYIVSPPEVIPIDVGRQLFVDDFLIESTNMERVFHRAESYIGNPVIKPDKSWEKDGEVPWARPVSDGVWYDPEDKLFKMWYMAGMYPRETCYAYSKDGKFWYKPVLDIVEGTNIVLPTEGGRRDSNTIWLDLNENNPQMRYKMWQIMHYGEGMTDSKMNLFFSGDGIHWQKAVTSQRRLRGERTTIFYNPFRKVWVYSLRNNGGGRHRDYQEDVDPVRGTSEVEMHRTSWIYADDLDMMTFGIECQLYTLDCIAYESLILGLFSVYRGTPEGQPKHTDVCLGYTRDGYYWTRPDRKPFHSISDNKDDWDYRYIQSSGGGCLVVGDKLYFYLAGTSDMIDPSFPVGPGYTGLVTLRRDGFASMNAGALERILTTRSVVFKGGHLFVNVNADNGELRIEVLDNNNNVIDNFSKEKCIPVKTDGTIQNVRWKEADDLFSLSGQVVKFRFYLKKGSLYSFWISPDKSGASYGYVAAGGPGFSSSVDKEGLNAYR
ncbi:glycosyl hydrolase family 32 [Bacteroidota bacterium]